MTLTAPANGATLYNDKPTLSGAAGIAAGDSMTVTVKVYSGSSASGTPVETLPVTALGSAWTALSMSTLSEGTYTAQAEQSDTAANLGKSSASTFKVITAAPTTTITSAPSGRVPIGELSISFNANEPGSTFQCSLDGVSYATCSSPYVIKAPAAGSAHVLGEGDERIRVYDHDRRDGLLEFGRTGTRPLRDDREQHDHWA